MFFRKLKLSILIIAKFISRKWKISSLGVLVAIILTALLLSLRINYPVTLTEGLIGTYQQHDLPQALTDLISSGLTKTDESGRITANLAGSWEVNNDATGFKFRLKEDLIWSDGSEVKSQDLEFSIPDVDVGYPDEKTIEFKLKNSFSPLPSLLTKSLFKKGTMLGVGPYKIVRIEKSRVFITKITLEPISKNSGYPSLIIRFYPNEKTARLAFEAGEVQALLGINDISFIGNNSLAKLKQITNYTKIVTILYNTKDPVLSNRSLRQALGYSSPAIKDEIEAKTSISPLSWAYFPDVNDYLENPMQAQSALKRAKTASGKEIFKKEIVLTCSPQLENIGRQVLAAWKELGLNVVLRVEGGIPQNFQMALLTQSIPTDPDQYSLWHSTQEKTNLTKYSSARADKNLEDGRKVIREDERKIKYIDFQETLLEDSPATFLYFPKYNIIYLKKAEKLLDKVLPLQDPR